MKFKVPNIKEIRFFIIEPEVILGRKVSTNDITFNFYVDAALHSADTIEFFIHIKYVLDKNLDHEDPINLFHVDYISRVKFNEKNWEDQPEVLLEKNFLAHLLGMTILMIRGSISTRIQGNSLSRLTIPVINPLHELTKNITLKEDKFVIKHVSNK